MGNENLYEIVKNRICDEIFKGHYSDADKLPPERELEEMLEVSRVTVRKSLEILEDDGLIVRQVGRGTTVTLRNRGNKSELDMIVLIAPARNPFFAEFIGRFQNYAETQGALLLYVEKPRMEELENCLYRLYKRGLRNAVVWLEDLPVDVEKLRRLRALGMNMVFFDSDKALPYADCVALDNALAIRTLYGELKKQGYERIGYIGWDLENAYSINAREEAYLENGGDGEMLLKIPWKDTQKGRKMVEELLKRHGQDKNAAVICSDRDCGEIACKAAENMDADIMIATVDEIAGNTGRDLLMYKQNLSGTVEQIFSCLKSQCTQEEKWNAKVYQIEGILLQHLL